VTAVSPTIPVAEVGQQPKRNGTPQLELQAKCLAQLGG